MSRRPGAVTGARQDQMLAALRDAGPAGLLTSEVAAVAPMPCLCSRRQLHMGPVPGCTRCHGSGYRPAMGSEAMPWLLSLERRGAITAERARPGSGQQNRWRLAEHAQARDDEMAQLDAWWDAIAAEADDEPAAPPADGAELLWLDLNDERDDLLYRAERVLADMDREVSALVDEFGVAGTADVLGLTPEQVTAAVLRHDAR